MYSIFKILDMKSYIDSLSLDILTNSDIILKIGRFLRHHRLSSNITQEDMSEYIGISRKTLSKIENGSNFTVLILIQILRYLNTLDIMNVFDYNEAYDPEMLFKLENKTKKRVRK